MINSQTYSRRPKEAQCRETPKIGALGPPGHARPLTNTLICLMGCCAESDRSWSNGTSVQWREIRQKTWIPLKVLSKSFGTFQSQSRS